MKILFVTTQPFPQGKAGTKRIKCYAKSLSTQNISSHVLIISRTERETLVNRATEGKIDDNISYSYISKSNVRPANKFIGLFYNIIDYFHSFFYCIRYTDKETIVYNYLDSNKIELMVAFACFFTKAKLCRELCEYPYFFVNSAVGKLRQFLMLHFTFKVYDAFLPISQALYDIALKYKSPKAVLLKVPILIDWDEHCFEKKSLLYPYIFHSGSLTERKDGFCGMLEAFGIVKEKMGGDLCFLSTGNPRNSVDFDRKRIDEIIKRYNIEQYVHFLDYLPEDELERYQNGSTMFIVNKYNTFQNKYCFATKLGEYLMCGVPVITTTIGEAKSYLTDNESAFIVEPQKPELLADKMMEVLQNEEKRTRVALKGKDIAETFFDYKKQGPILRDFFHGLTRE